MTDRPSYCEQCKRYMTAAEVIEKWHRCEEIRPFSVTPVVAPKAKRAA